LNPAGHNVVRTSVRLARRGLAAAGRAALDSTAAVISLSTPRRAGEPRSIFVLRNNDIGDLLVVTPLFEALARHFPRATLVAGVGDWAADVLRHNPHVGEVLPTNAPWFNKYAGSGGSRSRWRYLLFSPEAGELRQRRFDLGIDVLGSSWGNLLLARAGIPVRVGVRGYAGGHRQRRLSVAFDPREHVARTALRLAELLGATDLPPLRPQLYLTADELAEAEETWRRVAPDGALRVVVGPGGGLAARRWPAERFAEVAASLSSSTDVRVIVLTGPGEAQIAAEMLARAPNAHLPAAPLTLRPAFAVLARCDLLVCNSSMLMHAAAAFAKPAVVLLGPAFPSATAHQRQWGHEGLTVTLGPEVGDRDAATAEEALHEVRAILRRAA
jgi:heptosyltransferase-2